MHPKILEAKAAFDAHGVSVAKWARAHNFATAAAYQVLTEGKIPKRGERHQIAVAMGLKPQIDGEYVDLGKELLEIAQTEKE